ncbi:hypothetical protein KQI89_00630 [Clostridium sp. MSJ-4]|uniref:Phosphatidate cytidylyltransferase n=1 Tax=Clostridium simiarum TaxID=2841506 RepID=A0ABS6EVK9_9CLOT|nr:hypothetical protein [Clostridium simiarum]MBU5590262.1 hypothetical protein [Clostridium simiarum]
MNNLWGILISILFVLLVIGLSSLLTNRNIISGEGSRKFIHIGVSNWWIIAMLFFDNHYYASIVPAIFIVINYLSYKQNLFKAMERGGGKEDLGTVYFAVSLLILSFLTFQKSTTPLIGAMGILVMGYGDGFAAVVGSKFGKHKYYIGNNKKSIEGSLTMLIVSFIVSFTILNIYGIINGVSISLLISVIATLVEAVSPLGLDNITVPIISSALFYASILIN